MKINFYTLPLALSIGMFGCTQQSSNSAPAQQAPEETQEQEEFVSKLPDSAPTLKVATTGNMPPFSFRDEYGQFQGIDIDVIRGIGELQGFKVDFYPENWSDLFSSVEYGNRDLALSGISYRDDRAEKYGLSKSYFFNPSAIMYKDSSLHIQNLEDLEGMRVGVLNDSKQMQQVQELGVDAEIVPTTTTFLLFESLLQDEVDAIVQDLPLLQYTASNHPSQQVIVATYEDKENPSAQQVILMGKDDTRLIAKINEGIDKMKSTGEMAMIKGKWLSTTTPATIERDSDVTSETVPSTN